jgi:hypothetical protein
MDARWYRYICIYALNREMIVRHFGLFHGYEAASEAAATPGSLLAYRPAQATRQIRRTPHLNTVWGFPCLLCVL